MKFLFLLLPYLLFCFPLITSSQNVQWAAKVLKYSSQFSEMEFSAAQVLGKPNAMPTGGNSSLAWVVEQDGDHESTEKATLKLGYANPMNIQQIVIAENYFPGAVESVKLIDTDGDEHEVYNVEVHNLGENGRMLNIFIPLTTYMVEAVVLTIQPGKVDGWNQIDAVGISDSKDSVKATIHLASTIKFDAKPENLGTTINTQYSEIISAISHDGKTIYLCRTNHPDNFGGINGGQDAWYSTLNADSTWSTAVNMGFPINNISNNFVNSISPDGNTLLLGNCYKSDGSPKNGTVSLTHRTVHGWSMPENLTILKLVNKSLSVNFELSADGNVMLLSIQAEKTYGMKDLYVSFLTDKGEWTKPKNLGPIVNSIGDETSPFLADDGVTLYYSTNGISGYGNFDIFLTKRLDDTWTNWSEPENLGPGINTWDSENSFKLPASGEYAYFSSTVNSYGEKDIFRIALPKAIKPQPVVLVSGKVFNSKSTQPIEAAIKYEVLSDGSSSGVARSNPSTGEYKIVLPAGKDFGFRAEAKNYYAISENINTSTLSEYIEITKNLYLTPIEVGQTFRLNNIFFEFAKADLKPESFIELDRVITFLTEIPTVEILISGHSDNVGNDAHNLMLSDNRAQSVLKYIVDHGVSTSRITSKGFGKSTPVRSNDTEEGRQFNRRVEFTILKQ